MRGGSDGRANVYLLSDMQVVNPLPQSLSMPLMTDPLRVFLVGLKSCRFGVKQTRLTCGGS